MKQNKSFNPLEEQNCIHMCMNFLEGNTVLSHTIYTCKTHNTHKNEMFKMIIICCVPITLYLYILQLLIQGVTISLSKYIPLCMLGENEGEGERNGYKFSFSLVKTVFIHIPHLPNWDILLRSSCSSDQQRNLYCQSLHFLGNKNHFVQRRGDETRQANYIYCKFTNIHTQKV